MVKLYVERNETGIKVEGTLEGKNYELLTELTIGVRDLLNKFDNPEIAKSAFRLIALQVLSG